MRVKAFQAIIRHQVLRFAQPFYQALDQKYRALQCRLSNGESRWQWATLVFVVLAWGAIVPRAPVDLLTTHSWRKTQTFATRNCLDQAGDIGTSVDCLFGQHLGFDEQKHVGLEAPIFQLFDHLLMADIAFPVLENRAPTLGLSLILAALTICLLASWQSAGAAALANFALLLAMFRSPVVEFFRTSYQPDLFSLGLVLLGGALMIQWRWKRAPALLLALGIAAKPTHLIIAGALILASTLVAQTGQTRWKEVLSETVLFSLLVIAPYTCFRLIEVAVQYAGLARHYPSSQLLGGFIDPGRSVTAVFRLHRRLAGFKLAAAIAVLLAAVSYLTVTTKQTRILVLTLLPAVAAGMTFLIFFRAFTANTYYSIIFVGGLLGSGLLAIRAVGYIGTAKRTQILIATVVLVATVSTPESSSRQAGLLKNTFQCRPAIANMIKARFGQGKELLYYSHPLDPATRAAFGFTGRNVTLWNKDSEWVIPTPSLVIACKYNSKLLRDDAKSLGLLETLGATRVFDYANWIVFDLPQRDL